MLLVTMKKFYKFLFGVFTLKYLFYIQSWINILLDIAWNIRD
jgi:hypothetical protein